MTFIIVSGRSGAGKSIALHILEDIGYYCIDNLPITLLAELGGQYSQLQQHHKGVAVSVDARSDSAHLALFNQTLEQITQHGIHCRVLYLDADDTTLLKRYSETRRKHPLSSSQRSLSEAIAAETLLLQPLAEAADLKLDTSASKPQQLRQLIRNHLGHSQDTSLSVLIQSFGFKYGLPRDADFVFDVRCLPNPYWEPHLRTFTGLDQPVQDYLAAQDNVLAMRTSIQNFILTWLSSIEASDRSYLTLAIGCTGGQHRSVFITECLSRTLSQQGIPIQTRHRELA